MPGCSNTAASAAAAAPSPPASSRPGYYALLRSRSFALFFAAYSISNLGTAIVPVALTFALLGSGYSAVYSGLFLVLLGVPVHVWLKAHRSPGDVEAGADRDPRAGDAVDVERPA